MSTNPSSTLTYISAIAIALMALTAIGVLYGIFVSGSSEAPNEGKLSSAPEIQLVTSDTLPAWQTTYMLNEIKDYRRYIEKERQAYQDLLTRIYGAVGILIAAVAGIVGFFGIKTLQDLKAQSLVRIEQAKEEIEAKTRLQMAEQLSLLVQDKLSESTEVVAALLMLARKEAIWQGARIRVISRYEPYLTKMQAFEIRKLRNGGATVDDSDWQPSEDLSMYDAIIYAYHDAKTINIEKEDEEGHTHNEQIRYDAVLTEELLPALEHKSIPLIVYNYYHPDPFIDRKKSKSALDEYPYGMLANAPFTLMANAYDAITLKESISA